MGGRVNDWVSQSVIQSVNDIFYFSVFREHCRSLDKDKKQRQRHWERLSDLATLGQSWLFQTNWGTPITTLSLRVIDRQSDNNWNSVDVFIIHRKMHVFRCYLGFCSSFLPASYWWFWANSQPLQVIFINDETVPSCEKKSTNKIMEVRFAIYNSTFIFRRDVDNLPILSCYNWPWWNNNNLYSCLRAVWPLDIVGKILSVWY